MAGKLTIRRVGNFLPSLCLACILLVIAIISWLCTVGIPGCALRAIEEEAAKAGIQLHISKIRLSPSSGFAIKAEDVQVSIPQQDAQPAVLKLRKVQIAYSLGRMLTGQFRPVNIRLTGGGFNMPLNADKALKLEDIDVYTLFLRNGKAINTTLKARCHHIGLETTIHLSNPEQATADFAAISPEDEPQTHEPQSFEIPAAAHPYIEKFLTQIEQQEWNEKRFPVLNLSLIQGKDWKVKLTADIPDYDIGHLRFRDAHLEAAFENQVLTIDRLNFRTLDPDTTVTLQGGYDCEDRELEFSTKSTAPVIRIISNYLGEDTDNIVNKIQSVSNTTPTIELSGSARLTEDFALNHVSLRGKIEHRNLMLGSTAVNSLLLSFYMQDGRYNIDRLNLELPDGHITASARTEDASGHAEADISLSDETILNLARDFSGDSTISLPEGLDFPQNLALRFKGNMSIPAFEPGKSRLEDLIPTLHSCDIQFNTAGATFQGARIDTPAFTLHLKGLDYSGQDISAKELEIDALIGHGAYAPQSVEAENVLINLKLHDLNLADEYRELQIQDADFSFSTTGASMGETRLCTLRATAKLSDLFVNTADVTSSLRSAAVTAALNSDTFSHGDTTAENIDLKLDIPEGLCLADAWKNMQKKTGLQLQVEKISHGAGICATGTQLSLCNIAENAVHIDLSSKLADEEVIVQSDVALQQDTLLLLQNIRMHLPLARLNPLWGGEPLKELKLPGILDAEGSASFDTATNTLKDCHFGLQIPELRRVCNNVHVLKGKEIPLALDITGDFSTADNGEMNYKADVKVLHELGEMSVHVTGNPLSECRITGRNTIPVGTINELIDNVDAHWIMRDFRCTPRTTRNTINNIDATIRYDKGIYVHALCDVELYNQEFLLGAIRDKEDAQGNPTGEEYLRTDLSPNPYSRIKEGKCGVEVLVQLDCVSENGTPLPERIRINLNQPELTYDNRPWLKRMGIKDGAATGRITGEAVRFNIENNTISLHNLKGTCYPAYAIGMFYAPIQHFLEDVMLHDQASVATDYCIFPLSRNCDVPMQGLIRAEARTGAGFRFLGTTIPFHNFSGFINISDVDVYLDRMNAQSWGGVIDGSLRIGFAGKHTTLDGYIVASNLNLKEIVASYGEDFTPATCNGFIRFQAEKPELDALRAYGQVHLQDGMLMQLGLFRPVGALLSDMPGNLAKLQRSVIPQEEEAPPSWIDKLISGIFNSGSMVIDTMQTSAYALPFANHFLRYGIDEAFSRFDIKNGHLITRDMKAKGYNLNVGVQLDLDLNTLTINGDLWPKISSVPTALISPITILSDYLIDINIYGDVLAPQWEFGLSKKLKGEDSSLSSEPQKKE